MSFPSKVNIPISTNRSSEHNISAPHITTSDFMQFSVAKAIELVPNQSINIEHSLFARLAPMPTPTFGFAKIINRAYFVPFRTVYPAWNDFITDTPHNFDNGELQIPYRVPTFSKNDLVNVFYADTSFAITTTDGANADFRYINYNSDGSMLNQRYCNFTSLGRFVYKLLRSLGYNWTFTLYGNKSFSALPLLCAARVYMDFYYPSAYANDVESSWVNSLFVINSIYDGQTHTLFKDDLARLFKVLYRVCYESDYFTSVWDSPTGPNTGLSSSFSIPDITDESDSDQTYVNNNDGVANINTVPGASSEFLQKISQFSLNALRGLSDYLKRHQLSGSRAIDRYLSRFGIKLPDANLNRAMFIGEFSQDLQFGDVTSTSDTEGAYLGAYAGKGVSYGQGNYDFSSNEYGMFIVVSVIKPETYYFEGVHRHTKHLAKTDFYTPEFDNLGVQAMSVDEVYCPVDSPDTAYEVNTDNIFGFVPRYAEYKVAHSQITGDFLCNSHNTGMDSWYMFRSVKPMVDAVGGPQNFVHNADFVVAKDASQYNRIFYNTETNTDHFHIIHNFNIKSIFPGKPLYDTYEFENEKESKTVTFDINGKTH